MMGEALPGTMLAQAEAQRSLQNDVVYLQEYIETLKDNYKKTERPEQLASFISTMPQGPARQLAEAELLQMRKAADKAARIEEIVKRNELYRVLG
tara:strand:+ start:50 stop:334 length:285 start_codon:yes stop_codon:yes gene_type:complete